MMEPESTKTCRLCAETIKAAAKICPYCQSRQNRFSFLAGELPAVIGLLIAFGGVLFFLDRIFGSESEGESSLTFKVHRADLSIENFTWEVDHGDRDYWLSGYITNRGSYSWRIRELEMSIKDTQSNLVDVCHIEFEKTDAFVVLPRQEHAFKARFTSAIFNTNSILTFRVQRATDGRERYNPD